MKSISRVEAERRSVRNRARRAGTSGMGVVSEAGPSGRAAPGRFLRLCREWQSANGGRFEDAVRAIRVASPDLFQAVRQAGLI